MEELIYRYYQRDAIDHSLNNFEYNDRECICLPTGSGKTVIFAGLCAELIQRYPKLKIHIAVHRVELFESTLKAFKKLNVYAAKVDRTVKMKPIASITVCMAETLHRRLTKKRSSWNVDDVGLLLIDECHLGDFFKLLPLYKKIRGYTATPQYVRNVGQSLSDYYHSVYVPTTISKLINEGHLCSCITFAPSIKLGRNEVKTKGDDYDMQDMGNKLSDIKFIEQVVNYYKQYKDKRCIVYNSSVKHSKLVTEALQAVGAPCHHLDADSTNRKYILEWYNKTEGAWICNVGIATTGTDLPLTNIIMVNRLVKSLNLYLQICGRGSRPLDNKSEFIILDMHGNCLTHGEWSDERDWEKLFYQKRKKGKEGVAPLKECPQCGAVVPIQSTTCKHCQHIFEIKQEKEEVKEIDPVLVQYTKVKQKAESFIKKATERNHKMISVIFKGIEHYYNEMAMGKINEEDFRKNVYIVAELYYKEQGHTKMNRGHIEFVNKLIAKHLQDKMPQDIKDQIEEKFYPQNVTLSINETSDIF